MGLVTLHSSFRNQFVQLLYHRYTWNTRHIHPSKIDLVQNSQTLWHVSKIVFLLLYSVFEKHVQNRWTNPKIVVQICPNRQKVVQICPRRFCPNTRTTHANVNGLYGPSHLDPQNHVWTTLDKWFKSWTKLMRILWTLDIFFVTVFRYT